ncbi:methyltransferase [Colletotrichum orchidophilum]|uniref:Methyltransferase n=1 Tax=Colletotrichum orchidophilum TaxID=1209926 RepID=A0A1G4B2M0_9PEZI|nr:methyltransferase [Colletotrichum orchidophilum]OHE95583.1 methyltransferase [Colletotrichum orchidophilum]
MADSPRAVSGESPSTTAHLEPEEEGNTTDDASSIDERISNFTASLSSSVVDYPVEYGRRYHAYRPGTYKFPNDEKEMDRLDLAHAMIVKATGSKLFHAPLEWDKVHLILDIGTGTGLWAVEMGDIFEHAEVHGNDLSAIQPKWVPPNVKFEIDDVESPWVAHKKYDFIMCRYMTASIVDWPKLVRNIYDHLNPGGWVELLDMNPEFYSEDGSYTKEHATYKWNQGFLSAIRAVGRDPTPGPKHENRVREAGFTNVTAEKYKAPLTPWVKDQHYKDLGMMNLVLTVDGLEGFSMKLFTEVLGRTKEEVEVEIMSVKKELKANPPPFHALVEFDVVYGQKPITQSKD